MMKTKTLLLIILLVASFLRLFKLSSVPVSLFGDEVDVGYHAYSIGKTGRDYSGNFLPLHFQSLAESRTPLYLYSAVPTVAMFGVTPMGVRLPAAIFGILGVWGMYLLVKEMSGSEKLGLLSSLIIAVNPWHLQYSRAGFEVTMMLAMFLFGLWLFIKSISSGKLLWLSVSLLTLTPLVYSTAKMFTPFLLLFLLLSWKKEILGQSKKHLIHALVALLIIGIPIAYTTFFGGGAQRFSYISVFSDPTTEPEVGVLRQNDARVRGEMGVGLNPTLLDRVLHNKYTFWGKNVLSNYMRAFSTDFLFVKGDINPRHSTGTGEFYKFEALTLLLGLIFLFTSKTLDKRHKNLIIFWILMGVVPASITRDGANHATRLILILPPLVILLTYGAEKVLKMGKIATLVFSGLWVLSFGIYLHNYYTHYPWESERWWHAGWAEGVSAVKEVDSDYDKVAISMSGEPSWIFFGGHYMYDPDEWQTNFPVGNDVELESFGKVSHIGKFYFASPPGGLYEWGKVLDDKILYLANASEVKVNLILEPERLPGDLVLIKAISYPSGEPSMYLFSGKKDE